MKTIEEHNGKCELHVTCPDQFCLTPSTLDELLLLPNSGKYRILELTLGSDWGTPNAQLHFSLEIGPPIEIKVSGEDADVVKVYEKLDRDVSITYAGRWSRILDMFFLLPLPFLSIMSVCLASVLTLCITVILRDAGMINLIHNLSFGYIQFCMFTLGTAAPYIIRKLYTNIYPKGIFLIGAGVQEYEAIKSRRQIVSPLAIAVAIILALIVAIGVHWLGW
jgi:hypothetical protein